MKYIEGYCRDQHFMFPETVEQYISEENPVRFIDAIVHGLSFEQTPRRWRACEGAAQLSRWSGRSSDVSKPTPPPAAHPHPRYTVLN